MHKCFPFINIFLYSPECAVDDQTTLKQRVIPKRQYLGVIPTPKSTKISKWIFFTFRKYKTLWRYINNSEVTKLKSREWEEFTLGEVYMSLSSKSSCNQPHSERIPINLRAHNVQYSEKINNLLLWI